MKRFERLRKQMVEEQIEARGVRDPAVLEAMATVPRERFVPEAHRDLAYADSALPIEAGETISQPYVVAWMIEALRVDAESRVLEIGSGSGYAVAVLSRMVKQVYGVEIHPELVALSRQRLESLGYDNVVIHLGDGSLGWAEHAPYDAILVSAGAPAVPDELREQLVPGGRLVIPIGDLRTHQHLVRITRGEEADRREVLGGVRFVPLEGARGWPRRGAPEH